MQLYVLLEAAKIRELGGEPSERAGNLRKERTIVYYN
jgi:hypothetical protein